MHRIKIDCLRYKGRRKVDNQMIIKEFNRIDGLNKIGFGQMNMLNEFENECLLCDNAFVSIEFVRRSSDRSLSTTNMIN